MRAPIWNVKLFKNVMNYLDNHLMPWIWVFDVQLINSCAFHCELSTMTAKERGGTRETRKPICYLLPFSHSTPIYVWNKYINCYKATYWWIEMSGAWYKQEASRRTVGVGLGESRVFEGRETCLYFLIQVVSITLTLNGLIRCEKREEEKGQRHGTHRETQGTAISCGQAEMHCWDQAV